MKKQSTRSYLSEQGLTIIEILVVLIILGLVMGLLADRIFGAGDKAKVSITKLKLEEIKSQIEQYRLQYNALPRALEDLARCNEVTGQGCVPIANEEGLKDAWGNPLFYRLEGGGRAYKIASLGADAREGGEGVDYDVFVLGP